MMRIRLSNKFKYSDDENDYTYTIYTSTGKVGLQLTQQQLYRVGISVAYEAVCRLSWILVSKVCP